MAEVLSGSAWIGAARSHAVPLGLLHVHLSYGHHVPG